MLLRQISPNDAITLLVLAGLGKSAPILQDVQFYAKPGAADSLKRKRTGTTNAIFRSVNDSNVATPPTNVYDPVAKKIISFDAKVDVVLEDRNEDTNTELAEQTRLEAESAGYTLQEKIFEGSSANDPEEFDGIRAMVNVAWKKTTGGNGIVVPVGNSDANVGAQQVFVEQLLKFLAMVRGGAQYVYMNEYLKIRLISVAKNLGYYRQTKDELGNLVDQIGNTTLRGAGYKEDGTPLLPFTETVGAANNCSSMFAVRFGERADFTALTSVGIKARYSGQIGNFIINNVNMDMAFALPNPPALVQMQGFRLE